MPKVCEACCLSRQAAVQVALKHSLHGQAAASRHDMPWAVIQRGTATVCWPGSAVCCNISVQTLPRSLSNMPWGLYMIWAGAKEDFATPGSCQPEQQLASSTAADPGTSCCRWTRLPRT